MTLESIIELMHGDKSNDWSEEIAALSDHLLRAARASSERDEMVRALGDLGEALCVISAGEDFWEHFTYVEGSRLAEAFDAAGMREAAEHVRVECREADPEVWAEADDASAAAALS